jgi:hypothetical protein
LEPLGCELAANEDFGMSTEAKEAAAFALLAPCAGEFSSGHECEAACNPRTGYVSLRESLNGFCVKQDIPAGVKPSSFFNSSRHH